jgi:hypothetical protein
MLKKLTIPLLKTEAITFADQESTHAEPSLFGVTDGKAVGTYLEQKFQANLHKKYDYIEGSSAKGIDFPELDVDIKVTSIKQPQSSCPFEAAQQKIYGLGYNLLVFVYEKSDNAQTKTGSLDIHHTIFVDKSRTADFQTTSGISKIIENDANLDDMLAFFSDRMLPLDDIQAQELAEEVLANLPKIGYLTISNALQWRLQYSRVIQQAGIVVGIEKL